MQLTPQREEIDHRTIKLLVGVIALTLSSVTSFFAGTPISSISASYHAGGWAQSFFVGFLFAIAAFLLAYNGLSFREMVMSKIAALAAVGVALFPCRCDQQTEVLPYVHAAAVTTMFVMLAGFCYVFFKRARQKGYPQANMRAAICVLCGAAIVSAMLLLAIDALTGGTVKAALTSLGLNGARLTFYVEHTALIAFGISWLTASRVLPVITRPDERFSPLGSVPGA